MIRSTTQSINGSDSSMTPPTILVIFGASGDLTARKLAPAIYNLCVDGLMPSQCFLIGYGRKAMSDDDFKKYIYGSIEKYSRRQSKSKIGLTYVKIFLFKLVLMT